MISSIHRPTVAEVNLSAISHNIASVKEHLPADKQVFAVVKANAYGHGAIRVAHFIEKDVTGFCVSNLDEGIELRESGIVKPILVLGVVLPEEVSLAIQHQLTLTVASLEWLEMLQATGMSVVGLECHVKIDSGMGRIGVRSGEDANRLVSGLRKLGITVSGVFTHFATADEADESYFYSQLETFKQIIADIEDCPDLVHASNSATSIWHTDTVFNAVRLGVVMYGLNPSGDVLDLPYELEPALSLESRLVHVKTVAEGTSIGYGATYHTLNDGEVIGTIPIGYADGWTRDMQGFKVLVDGQVCEIVGRVSMDQLTVRLPKVYPLGTPVTLLGENGDARISATEVANYRGTINYEVLCLISDRIPRQYKES